MGRTELEQLVEETRIKNTNFKEYFEDEIFNYNGTGLFSVLDFWRYQYSNLASIGEYVAEFCVAKALGLKKAENSVYWTAYDMSYRNKRIEIKFTQYVHFWNKTKVSKQRSFSIMPTNEAYWKDTGENVYKRHNDLYVFCLNDVKEIGKYDPLQLADLEFFVIPTFIIDAYASEKQKTISLNVVKRLAKGSVNYLQLKDKIDQVINEIENR